VPSGSRKRVEAPAREGEESALFVRSAARAFAVLEAFKSKPRPLSLGELASATGLGKSATQRLVHTLQRLGYLMRDPENRGYIPGTALLDRSFDALRVNPVVERATAVLLELRRNARERVDFSLFDRMTIVYAVRLQSKRETFNATLVGRRLPTYCSSGGRAALSRLPETEARAILEASDRQQLTARTIVDLPEILAKVSEARRDGFALALEEILIGEVVLAAPVLGNDGRPVGAVHIAGSLSEWRVEDFRARFAPLATEAARAIGP